ncbi:formate/nitrite transporter family protein [Pseudacidobacterium ailaaui]|uniref:formate/nitrite transporter family protein n=1 Tax=Pseudacidobacterium ailaaui TaxID=1382359 RepID=UPI00047C049C|nr:formate/nitrite transporter family protein [Pseudacidobacterium ailaaui]MBX6359244.1 formate/nitrite transporter family protein [Pseudacidobacterium ailaaui]MCL6465109.1 formate/nitrite transporter family protein [Pseudacidobacterium ailaaui]MDI3255856.1 formate/nitrite transporter family protein [Bacillota bacterium]
MDYVKPLEVAETFLANAVSKSRLSVGQLLLRGFLSGALLGFATTVAFTATAQNLPPILGAILFPVGFAMIVVLGLELVTGSFAMLPAAWIAGGVTLPRVLVNLALVFLGNLIGGCLYAWLYAMVLTQFHHVPAAGAGTLLIAAAQAKTLAYQKLGMAGLGLSVIKAMLCNWMVCMGVVMGLTSRSTLGKIAACWLPIFTFFALGYEHSVVNMFILPAGILLGAPVSLRDWWLWNQLPVTFGNLFGGLLFVGLPMLWMSGIRETKRGEERIPTTQPEAVEA